MIQVTQLRNSEPSPFKAVREYDDQVFKKVREILSDVEQDGDKGLLNYTSKYDGISDTENLYAGLNKAFDVSDNLKNALNVARKNITTFHESQIIPIKKVTTSKGVTCWRKSIPIQKIGLYIPGGSAPLYSTLLMLAIPALLAGCPEIIICTPPDENGEINPAIGYVASLLGLKQVFLVGGAQAIAAMAYGTETIPKVDKIFGPGNAYVTVAKMLVQQGGVAIDLPAGPSELAILADDSADPDFVAADLLSQAEHGPDSSVYLFTTSNELAKQVETSLGRQIEKLPRKEIALQSLQNSAILIDESMLNLIDSCNELAPEHLIINTLNAEELSESVINAGSVFLGAFASESIGDYASGTNHTLPTNGFSKSYSGVSLDSFVRKITFQRVTEEGLMEIGPTVETLAEGENLLAHKEAISVRLKKIKNENER